MSTVYGTCESCHMDYCGNCRDNGSTDTNYLSKAVKKRCSDCVCLITGEYGEWYCDEANQLCMAVKKCPEGLELEV